jgi:hypothetical protein
VARAARPRPVAPALTTHQLAVEVAHAQHAPRRLAHGGERLGEQVVQRRACCQAKSIVAMELPSAEQEAGVFEARFGVGGCRRSGRHPIAPSPAPNAARAAGPSERTFRQARAQPRRHSCKLIIGKRPHGGLQRVDGCHLAHVAAGGGGALRARGGGRGAIR